MLPPSSKPDAAATFDELPAQPPGGGRRSRGHSESAAAMGILQFVAKVFDHVEKSRCLSSAANTYMGTSINSQAGQI